MTHEDWLDHACADADLRELPELKPLLTTLVQATRILRAADWNDLAGAVRQQADDGQPGDHAHRPHGAGR
jgi:hypothetical protein